MAIGTNKTAKNNYVPKLAWLSHKHMKINKTTQPCNQELSNVTMSDQPLHKLCDNKDAIGSLPLHIAGEDNNDSGKLVYMCVPSIMGWHCFTQTL